MEQEIGRDECQHGSLRRVCAVCERDQIIADLKKALTLCMVGGNHLATHIGWPHPSYGAPHEDALKQYGPGMMYDMWCCWDAIMRARDIRDKYISD